MNFYNLNQIIEQSKVSEQADIRRATTRPAVTAAKPVVKPAVPGAKPAVPGAKPAAPGAKPAVPAKTIGLDENPDLSKDPNGFKTSKKPIPLNFRTAEADATIQTKEGPVNSKVGDAIMTGTEGEQWPIPADRFKQTYDVLKTGIAAKKNIPVFAKIMNEPFQVKVSWSNNLLQGKINDVLVQYGVGDYGVVGNAIFKKTYH
jgi:hypothetical protein